MSTLTIDMVRDSLSRLRSGTFSGIRVIVNPHHAQRVQYRFPRSKKRRIRKKWSQRESNFRMQPFPPMLMSNDGKRVFIVSMGQYEALKRSVAPAADLWA